MKLSRRILAMIVALVMITASFPVAMAEEAVEPVVEVVEIVETPVEEPVEEPVVEEAPAEEPVEEPVVEETPAEEPVEEPVVEEIPAEEPVEEPVVDETPAEEPVEEPEVEETPAEEPVEEPVVEETPAEEPVEEPVVDETPAEEPEVLFSEGYAVVTEGVVAYADETLETAAGAFEAESVVYVLSRSEEDVFAIVYAAEDIVCNAFITAEAAVAMSEEAIAEYMANALEPIVIEETGVVLLNCAFVAADEEQTEVEIEGDPIEEIIVGENIEDIPAIAIPEIEVPVDDEDFAPSVPMEEEGETQATLVTGITIVNTNNVSGAETAENPVKLVEGLKMQLIASVNPDNADNRQLDWSIVEGAASVSANGLVTAKAVSEPSNVIVKAAATDGSGVSATFCITVVPKAEKITVKYGEKTVNAKVAEVIELVKWEEDPDEGVYVPTQESNYGYNVVIEPAGTLGYEAVSSNENIVTAEVVDGELQIMGWKTGTAKVTVTSLDGAKKFAFNVKVQRSAESITFTNAPIVNEETGATSYTVARGRTITLKYTVNPEETTNKAVTFSTSDRRIATVTAKGVVKGIKAGTATITVASKDGKAKAETTVVVNGSATSSVKVKPNTGNNYLLFEGEGTTFDLSAEFAPAAANPLFTWTVDDEDIASIEAKEPTQSFTGATLTFKEAGSVKVTAAANDGSNRKAAITITAVEVPVETVTASVDKIEIARGKTFALSAAIGEDDVDADYPGFVWTSADPKVATVTAKGVVKGIKASTTTIYATSIDGLKETAKAAVEVTVMASPATRVTLSAADSATTVDFNTTNKIQLTATVIPAKASQKVAFTSSNPEVATVDADGLVTFLQPGSVKITAKATDGSNRAAAITLKAAKKIVSANAIGVEYGDHSNILLPRSGSITLKLEAIDANGAVVENAAFTYKSSNAKIASISATGMMKGVKAGEVTITATPKDGVSDPFKFIVTVVNPASALTVADPADLAINFDLNDEVADTKQIVASVDEAAASKVITYKTSNAKVATVSETGLVEAVGVGSATITVTPLGAARLAKKITVKVVANTLSLTKGENDPTEVAVNKAVKLSLTRDPNPASDTLVWEATSENGGRVALSGKSNTGVTVKGVRKGTVTVKAYIKEETTICEPAVWTIEVRPITTRVSVTLPEGADKIVNLNEEDSVQLIAQPANAGASTTFTWKSNNEKVATVDANGLVTAVKYEDGTYLPGIVKISATATDGSKRSATMALTFQHNVEEIVVNEEFHLDEDGNEYVTTVDSVELTPKQTFRLYPDARNEAGNATNTGVTYKSTKPAVAVVSAAGVITAKAAGETQIIITAKDGSGVTKTIDVFVYALTSKVILNQIDYVESDELDEEGYPITEMVDLGVVTGKTLYLYDTEEDNGWIGLKASSSAAKESMQDFVWTSSNYEVANFEGAIDDEAEVGICGGEEYGTAKITATAQDGSRKSAYVNVVYGPAVDGVLISGSHSLTEGKSTQLTANVFPANALNAKVEWSVDAASAELIEVVNGKVTAKTGASGQARVNVKAYSNYEGAAVAEDTYVLNIVPQPTDIELLMDDVEGDVSGLSFEMSTKWTDKTVQLTAKLSTEGSSVPCNQAVTWRSSNAKVAKVDESGLVTAVAASNKLVTITATSVDNPNVKASIKVKVTSGAIKLTVDNENGYEEVIGEDNVITYKIAKAYNEDNNGELAIMVKNAPANTPMTITYGSEEEKKFVEYEAISDLDGGCIWFVIRAAEIGTAHFTLTPEKMSSAPLKFNIEVVEPLTELELDVTELKLNINDKANNSKQLEIISESYDDRKLIWTVIHEDEEKPCVSVDENGLVKALRAYDGDMQMIQVAPADGSTTADGEAVYAECKVRVVQGVKSIKVTADMSGRNPFLLSGDTLQLTATVVNMDGTKTNKVTWSMGGGPEDVTISETGLLTIPADYECAGDMESFPVVATAMDGISTAEYYVNVTSPDMLFDVEKDGDIVRITRVWYGSFGGGVEEDEFGNEIVLPAETFLEIPEYVFIEGSDGYERIKWTHLGSNAFPATVTWDEGKTEELTYYLKELVLPEGIVIEEGALANLTKLVTESGNTKFIVFNGTLYSYTGKDAVVTVPKMVTKIGDGAFANNTTVTTVKMPNSVTEIGVRAFAGCTALKQMTCY